MKKIYCFILFLIGMFFTINPSLAINGADIYKNVADSVVYVEVDNAKGSGVIVEEDGTFVTCFHVVADTNNIEILTKNGKKYKVNGYKYLSPKDDIAILTISSNTTFKPIKISTQKLSIGESVYTISNPRGIQFVFTDGMISQLNEYDIQFSAPVSSGSSGGALLNSKGELIGIISSQLSPRYAQNLNFAVPNKFFNAGLEKKKTLNTKKLPWTDFIISRGTKKFLTEYIGFMIHSDSLQASTYKISKALIKKNKNVTSADKIKLSFISVLTYLYNPEDDTPIKEAYVILDEVIAKNEQMEKALILKGYMSIISLDLDTYKATLKLSKPYPKAYKFLKAALKKLAKTKNSDDFSEALSNVSESVADIVFED